MQNIDKNYKICLFNQFFYDFFFLEFRWFFFSCSRSIFIYFSICFRDYDQFSINFLRFFSYFRSIFTPASIFFHDFLHIFGQFSLVSVLEILHFEAYFYNKRSQISPPPPPQKINLLIPLYNFQILLSMA